MCRYFFYLAVGFITFGLSVFGYFAFELRKADVVQAETLHESPELFESAGNSYETHKAFKCENQYLLTVWNQLRQDELTKEVFERGIEQGELQDCADVIGIEKLVDLNGDGNLEAVISGRGWLNGIGESSNWIVTKNAEDNKVILDHAVGEFELGANKTEGFYDISFSFKTSIEESDKILYRFDGNAYKPKQCWTEIIAARNRRQRIYELKKPRKIARSCWN